MALKPLAISALALLNERPMHPYEMYQVLLERHEDRLVRVSAGTLYRAVERLTDAGYVRATGTERQGNRPERTTYAITPAGRRALVARIREVLRTPINEYPQIAVALSEAHNAPAADVIADLRNHRDALDAEIAELDTFRAYADERNIPEAYLLAVSYLRHTKVATCDWLTDVMNRLEKEDLLWP